jgi:predicted Zn finger-like uncharacterized protein
MKFYCDSCGAKYLIGDEKVRGKVLRIRCKKCDHVISVREPTAPTDSGSMEQLQRKLQERAAATAPQTAWHYSVAGQSFGPMGLEALRAKFSAKELGDETYLWHESFDGWKPARECEVVADLFQQGAVRKPRNPTISLSTNEIRALAERRSQELQAQQAASSTPSPSPSSASSTGTSILQRATRSRVLERPTSAVAAPVVTAAAAPARPTLARPEEEDPPSASPQDRIRALRERLRANAPAQPSAGSLRDRLRAVGQPSSEAASSAPSSAAASASAPAPQRGILRPAGAIPRPALRPQPLGSTGRVAPREAEEEVIPTVIAALEAEVVPTVIAAVEPPEADEETFEAHREEAEAPQWALAPQEEEAPEPIGIAAALGLAAQEAGPVDASFDVASLSGDAAVEPVASTDEEAAFFDAPAPRVEREEAFAPLPFVAPSPTPAWPSLGEDDDLRPSHTSTGLFDALPPVSPGVGGLRPISPEAQASAAREDSVSSASLLIQLDSLKKAQRSRQLMFAGAALALLLLVGVTGFILFTYASDSKNKELAQEAEAARAKAERERSAQRGAVDQRRTYDPNTLRAMGGELAKPEEAPAEAPSPAVKTDKVAVKPPTNPLLGSGDKLDKALAGAGAAAPTETGLKAGDPGGAGEVSRINRLEANPMEANPTMVLEGASRTRIEGREKEPEGGAPAALPKSLDKAALDKGFEGVRRSVDQCLARHRKVHGEPPKGKVKLGVTISRSGQVSALSIDDDVANSVFHSCMLSHRTRWAFPAFDGESIEVRKSFVLQ